MNCQRNDILVLVVGITKFKYKWVLLWIWLYC